MTDPDILFYILISLSPKIKRLDEWGTMYLVSDIDINRLSFLSWITLFRAEMLAGLRCMSVRFRRMTDKGCQYNIKGMSQKLQKYKRCEMKLVLLFCSNTDFSGILVLLGDMISKLKLNII